MATNHIIAHNTASLNKSVVLCAGREQDMSKANQKARGIRIEMCSSITLKEVSEGVAHRRELRRKALENTKDGVI